MVLHVVVEDGVVFVLEIERSKVAVANRKDLNALKRPYNAWTYSFHEIVTLQARNFSISAMTRVGDTVKRYVWVAMI